MDRFQWPSGIILQIQCAAEFPRSLQRELGKFKDISDDNSAVDARIFFCRHPKEMPSAAEMLRGRYKGMPWEIALIHSAHGGTRYFFYAPFFSVFLFVRTCLIPILKKITIERGGFFLIGSAFIFRGITFILSGKPGSGKTWLLLKGLDAGGRFLGDSELMLTADRKILPAFPYIEARRNTLLGTSHWDALDFKSKATLWFCHALSRVSFGVISFNLLLDSVDSKKTPGESSVGSSNRCFVIQLRKETDGGALPMTQDFFAAVDHYEAGYQRLFGGAIYTPQLRCLGLNQLKSLLSEAVFQAVSSRHKAYDFLQKEMKNDECGRAVQS